MYECCPNQFPKKKEKNIFCGCDYFFFYKRYALKKQTKYFINPSFRDLMRNPDLFDVDLNFSLNNMAAPMS